jgi:hypothetical protein
MPGRLLRPKDTAEQVRRSNERDNNQQNIVLDSDSESNSDVEDIDFNNISLRNNGNILSDDRIDDALLRDLAPGEVGPLGTNYFFMSAFA